MKKKLPSLVNPRWLINNHKSSVSKGFTIIELIIVFSIIAIISTMGIASFQSYSDAQKLRTAMLDLRTMLQQARSQSSSQIKPTGCGIFRGYEVRVCGQNPACLSTDPAAAYELDAACSSFPSGMFITSVKLTSGVSLDQALTTQYSFLFIPITGGVVQGGSVVFDGANNAKLTITVTNAGAIL